MTDRLIIYTDGGCSMDTGDSGWAFVIPGKYEEYGFKANSTNNEMELTAMLNALTYAGKDTRVKVYSDSTYVVKGLTEWVYGWIRRGWITSSGTPVANKELWEALYKAYNPAVHEILYVRGHAGIEGNERCDELVQLAKIEKKSKVVIDRTQKIVEGDAKITDMIDVISMKYDQLLPIERRNLAPKILTKLAILTNKIQQDA